MPSASGDGKPGHRSRDIRQDLVAEASTRYHPSTMRNKRNAQGSLGVPARKPGSRASRVSVTSFRDDPLFPRIDHAVAAILRSGKMVAPVDVLVGMDLLAPEKLEAWRQGEVPYLERAISCNLTRLSRLLRILRFHAHDLNLVSSVTAYLRSGKGPKQRLRFTRSGDPKLEEAYARHYTWPGKGPFHMPVPR